MTKKHRLYAACSDFFFIQVLKTRLQPAERSLISMRYFQNKTQMEIASLMGISQVQVSRLEKKILLRLREKAIR